MVGHSKKVVVDFSTISLHFCITYKPNSFRYYHHFVRQSLATQANLPIYFQHISPVLGTFAGGILCYIVLPEHDAVYKSTANLDTSKVFSLALTGTCACALPLL